MALAGMVKAWLRVGRTAPLEEVSRRWKSQLWEGRPLPAAGGGHYSGSPALRRAPRVCSTWTKYVGSLLIAVQEARTRETV
jgi:hypothetical protein